MSQVTVAPPSSCSTTGAKTLSPELCAGVTYLKVLGGCGPRCRARYPPSVRFPLIGGHWTLASAATLPKAYPPSISTSASQFTGAFSGIIMPIDDLAWAPASGP